MNLEDPTLEIISALARRVEAQDKTIAEALAIGARLERDLAFVQRELNAHLHAPQMHGGPGGPAYNIMDDETIEQAQARGRF